MFAYCLDQLYLHQYYIIETGLLLVWLNILIKTEEVDAKAK